MTLLDAPNPDVHPNTFEGDRSLVEWALLRVRVHARRRVAWLRHLWSTEGQAASVEGRSPGVISHAEVDAILDGRDARADETAWWRESAHGRALSLAVEDVEQAWVESLAGTRWGRLRDALGLSSEDLDVVQLLLAVHVEPSLARLCGYLHDDASQCYASMPLVARLFAHERPPVLLGTRLLEWRVVSEEPQRAGEPAALVLDPAIAAWLLDGTEHTAGSVPATLPEALPSWPVEEIISWVSAASHRGLPARVEVLGEAGSGRRTFVAACTKRLGQRVRFIEVVPHLEPRAALAAARLAQLEGETLAWIGPRPADVPHAEVEWLVRGVDDAGAPSEGGGVLTRTVVLGLPSVSERQHLWRELVPVSEHWPAEEVASLAERFRLYPGEIDAVGQQAPATAQRAEHLVRSHGRGRLDRLAELVECPFTWDDLVVGEVTQTLLRELESTARARPRLWERPGRRRLFPGGRGLLALFSGPPGTGKTMSAQVLAASLGVDLVRIDLSQVVSKYVGETSQNLDRILRRAERLDVVLLFDEADAIFGRRTEVKDAHDRYANTDTAYLLQAMEQYPGLALLSTNRKADIDPAFLRRFRFIVEFEKPGIEERAAIWRRVLTELATEDTARRLGPALETVAAGVEATGAQIKFAALGALLHAERESVPLEIAHLLEALGRELRKDGRAFGVREQERLLREARDVSALAAERQ